MTCRFGVGEAVRVSARSHDGHCRTPRYIRGKRGTVERICGSFPNPELLAYSRPAGSIPLYRVRFAQSDVWEHYGGERDDTVDVELYEHWLEPAGGTDG